MTRISSQPLGLFAVAIIGLLLLATALGRAPAVAAQSKAAEEGAALFTISGCPQCHGPEGLGTAKAPSLRDVRKRKTDDQVRLQIKEGGKIMPPFGEALTDQQIASLVEFLRSKHAWTGTLSTSPKTVVSK
jgi:mono/diheme cytochrome c family protein